MNAEAIVVGVAGLGVAAVATPVCITIARRTDIMDRPGALKSQETPIPYLGGLAVFAGLAVGVSAGRPVVLVPLFAALAVGVVDDRFDLPAPLRLLAQLGVGALIAVMEPVHLPGWLGVPLILAVTIIVINGFNLIDGLDMLAAGVGTAAAAGFAVVVHGDGSADGRFADRGSDRLPLVQSTPCSHLPGGWRVVPARDGHRGAY